jgi:nucleoid-associated protein YgaU
MTTASNWGRKLLGVAMVAMLIGCAGLEQKMEEWDDAIQKLPINDKLRDIQAKFIEKTSLGQTQSSDKGTGRSSEAQARPDDFEYRTQWSWETFATIGAWYTGDVKNSQRIAQANSAIHGGRIPVGSAVLIPRDLLVTTRPPQSNYAAKLGVGYYEHRVRWEGETLSLIAKWYTGDPDNWRALAKFNPKLNPNRIKVGDRICVPKSLLQTREPLPQKVAAQNTGTYFAHTVRQPGETFSEIATWYTGSAANWKALAKANPTVNPKQLNPGDEIFIPAKLLKTHKPLPSDESVSPAPQPAKLDEASGSGSAPDKEPEFELIGPKQFPRS